MPIAAAKLPTGKSSKLLLGVDLIWKSYKNHE